MTGFAILQLLAWAAVGAVMILFACTGGFDLGAGMLLPFIGRNDNERRVVLNVVGPTWDGNQVWLIIVGGAIFAIWPRVYAATFSGFYFAMLILLWALFLRPVAFEYHSKIQKQGWRTFWVWALFVGSVVPALIIGVGIGNVIMGVPYYFDPVTLRFFYTGTFWGLLRGFPILCGLVCIFMMIMHGSAYVALRTQGMMRMRAQRAGRLFALLFFLFFVIGGIWLITGVTGYQLISMPADPSSSPLSNVIEMGAGRWLHAYLAYPVLFLVPLIGLLSVLCVLYWHRGNTVIRTFYCSALSIALTIATFGLTLFPFVMPSNTHPNESLLLWNASSSALSLAGILVCALIMLPIIFIYTTFVYRKLWGRSEVMTVEKIEEEGRHLY